MACFLILMLEQRIVNHREWLCTCNLGAIDVSWYGSTSYSAATEISRAWHPCKYYVLFRSTPDYGQAKNRRILVIPTATRNHPSHSFFTFFFLSLLVLVLPHAKYRGSLGKRAERRQSNGYGEAYRVAFQELMWTSWHVGIHLRLFTRVPATKRAQPASRGY